MMISSDRFWPFLLILILFSGCSSNIVKPRSPQVSTQENLPEQQVKDLIWRMINKLSLNEQVKVEMLQGHDAIEYRILYPYTEKDRIFGKNGQTMTSMRILVSELKLALIEKGIWKKDKKVIVNFYPLLY